MPTLRPPQPTATLALIGISALLYLLIQFLGIRALRDVLMMSEIILPPLAEIRSGQWWRLVTPIFLHFSIFHIVFNLLWVWELGRVIEARHGALALLLATALIGGTSNLAQYYASGANFGGMSGVVYGYFGYVWIQGLFNPRFGFRLATPIVVLLLGWLALAATGILELFNLHIANTAHFIGLLGGILLALANIAIAKRNLNPFHRARRP